MNTYCPPASGYMAPSSAQARPAISVMPPTTIHSNNAIAGFGTARSTSAGTMKMDAPMVPLTTIITESNSVS